MNATSTALPGVVVLEPNAWVDDRGYFFESWNARTFAEVTGVDPVFVQDNHSRSRQWVLRGLHYQLTRPQGKLVRVVSGRVFDVVVDLRRSSATFRTWIGVELSADNRRQLWIPPGFGHGFLVLSEFADFVYKTTDFWFAQHDRCVFWNDPDLAISWPLPAGQVPVVGARDAAAPPLCSAELFE